MRYSQLHSTPSPPQLKTLQVLLVITAVALMLALGCSGGSNPGGVDGDNDDQAGARIHVDVSNVGVEDGTLEHPYNTIDEGIAAASRGDTVIVAAGNYTRRTAIDVPVAIAILGAGRDQTIVDAYFSVSAPEDTMAVRFKHMAFDGATFAMNIARVEYAPIRIDSCDAGVVGVGYPPEHSYTVMNSEIDSVRFAQGDSEHASHVLRNCVVTRGIHFTHGSGNVVTVIDGCTIGGMIRIACASGPTFTITDNVVHGIYDASGACFTTIEGNTLPTGDIVDSSGGWGSETQFIESNTIQNGVMRINSGCTTVRYNTVNAPVDTFAILMNCGAPANLVGNTVILPGGAAPTGAPETWRNIGIKATCGEGVIQGNTVSGGSIGIWDVSGATALSWNTVSGAYYGIVAALGMDKPVNGNTVLDCSSDGIRFLAEYLSYDYGPFQGNTVSNNGGAGVRLFRDIDLGGGAQGSVGCNTITGNADYDLYVEVPADTAAVVYARGNTWDHASEAEVDTHDIYDANDDPSLADVDLSQRAN